MSATIYIQGITLKLCLGWTQEERALPQPISIDVAVHFQESPKACDTDELNQTVCYEKLVALIQNFCKKKSFRLMESLAQALSQEIHAYVKEKINLELTIQKKSLRLPDVIGPIVFSYRT